MTRAFELATRRSLALFSATFGAAFALALVPITADAPGTAVAVLAAIVVAVAAPLIRRAALAADLAAVALPPDLDAPEMIRARVTDPVHHPRRPRAPGQA